MSEERRKQLIDLCDFIAGEAEDWYDLGEYDAVIFWRNFFELRDLLKTIEAEFPEHEPQEGRREPGAGEQP